METKHKVVFEASTAIVTKHVTKYSPQQVTSAVLAYSYITGVDALSLLPTFKQVPHQQFLQDAGI